MGLIDRWFTKNQDEQLKARTQASQDKGAEKSSPVKSAPKAVKATKEKKEKTEKAVVAKAEGQDNKTHGAAHRVLVHPLITEKSAIMGGHNKYMFVVDRNAGKDDVKRAMESVYGVSPLKINIINMSGHVMPRRGNGRSAGRRSDFKKAIITLREGQSITVHEGV